MGFVNFVTDARSIAADVSAMGENSTAAGEYIAIGQRGGYGADAGENRHHNGLIFAQSLALAAPPARSASPCWSTVVQDCGCVDKK